jgi:hypothetical protein
MPFWKSKGSSLLKFSLASFVLLRVTLSGVTSYPDVKEIRQAISQSQGVDKVELESESPGFILYNVQYDGETTALVDKLSTFFSEKYKITQKKLPSGTTEINFSGKN